MRQGKRERLHLSSPLPKRPRPTPAAAAASDEKDEPPTNRGSLVVVSGLGLDCTVLAVKSRFELFGGVSRLRIDRPLGIAYVTFRSHSSALAAIAAALDPSSPITIDSQQVCVSRPNNPLPQWRAGVEASSGKDHHGRSSKLLRAEIPLSRYGRGNKKLGPDTVTGPSRGGLELSFKGREIVAYDDLL